MLGFFKDEVSGSEEAIAFGGEVYRLSMAGEVETEGLHRVLQRFCNGLQVELATEKSMEKYDRHRFTKPSELGAR